MLALQGLQPDVRDQSKEMWMSLTVLQGHSKTWRSCNSAQSTQACKTPNNLSGRNMFQLRVRREINLDLSRAVTADICTPKMINIIVPDVCTQFILYRKQVCEHHNRYQDYTEEWPSATGLTSTVNHPDHQSPTHLSLGQALRHPLQAEWRECVHVCTGVPACRRMCVHESTWECTHR